MYFLKVGRLCQVECGSVLWHLPPEPQNPQWKESSSDELVFFSFRTAIQKQDHITRKLEQTGWDVREGGKGTRTGLGPGTAPLILLAPFLFTLPSKFIFI